MYLVDFFTEAIEKFGSECEALRFLPENRYNKSMFPTTGQYDWFSGQLLYCVVRHMMPDKILEISTSSGYSTTFMALALMKNGHGKIDTYELDGKAAGAASLLFKKLNLETFINVHIGDAQKTSISAPRDYGIYFLDSLHTENFARWFIERHVLSAENDTALFHMHDIMPRHARVRCWNAPPFAGTPLDPDPPLSLGRKFKRYISSLIHRGHEEDNGKKCLSARPPSHEGEMWTYDGNCTAEAELGNKLAALMKTDDNLFVYDIVENFPMLSPHRYDEAVIGRANSANKPMEWNESWWCKVKALKNAYADMV